jgi:polar amino acid transport system ATP-binding protein
VLDVIEELESWGMNMVIVTRELEFARRVADRALMMDKGRIVEASDPAGFFSSPKREGTHRFLDHIA